MLQNIIFSLNIVLPWIIMTIIGVMLRYFKIVDDGFLTIGNKIVFLVFLPVMLFGSVFNAELSDSFDVGFILFVAIWTIISFLVVWILSLIFIKDRSVVSAFVQGSCRSNVGALAVPLAFSVLGEGAIKSVLALVVLIPLYNIICIILLTVYSEKDSKQMNTKGILVSILKNPPIISIVLGVAISLSGLSLPIFVDSTISALSQVTVPFVLICLGANIIFSGVDDKFKYAFYSSVIKVVIMPAAVTLIGFLLGFRGEDLIILMLLNGVPAAIAGYVMVVEIGGDSNICAKNIVLTTVFSAFTLASFIFLFRTFEVI